MSQASVLSKDDLAKAAFQLLASSTLDRYLRIARQVGTEAHLVERFHADPVLADASLERVQEQWSELLAQSQRDLPEVEIAVLLVALADAGVSRTEKVLHEMTNSNAPSTLWLKALSTQLLGDLLEQDYASLASMMEAWLQREHRDIPDLDPDTIERMQLEAA